MALKNGYELLRLPFRGDLILDDISGPFKRNSSFDLQASIPFYEIHPEV